MVKQDQASSTIKLLQRILVPVVILILWIVLSEAGLTNKSVLPTPQKFWDALVQQVESGALWKHIRYSLFRVLKGYLIGAAAGIGIGVLAALHPVVGRMIEAPVGILRPIPAIALIPFFILWMGIGEKSKVAVIIFGTFWPVLLNTMQGIRATDRKLLEVGAILEKSRAVILWRIVFPSAIPSVLTGLRLGMSSAWTCVVAAEMIAASAGIGFLITYSREMAKPATLMVGILVIGLFGLLIDLLFGKLNRVLVFWEKPIERS